MCGKHCWKLESVWNHNTFSCWKTSRVFNLTIFFYQKSIPDLFLFNAKKLEIILKIPTDLCTDNQQGKIFPENIPKLFFSTNEFFKKFPKREKVKTFCTKDENFPKSFGWGFSQRKIPKNQDHLTFFAPFQNFYRN